MAIQYDCNRYPFQSELLIILHCMLSEYESNLHTNNRIRIRPYKTTVFFSLIIYGWKCWEKSQNCKKISFLYIHSGRKNRSLRKSIFQSGAGSDPGARIPTTPGKPGSLPGKNVSGTTTHYHIAPACFLMCINLFCGIFYDFSIKSLNEMIYCYNVKLYIKHNIEMVLTFF